MTDASYVPAAAGHRAPDGRVIVAWRISAGHSTAEPVYAPDMLRQPRSAEKDYSGLDILRTDRGFKKQSFWRFKDALNDFLFTLPPEADVPNDERVNRVPRSVYEKLKKELPAVPADRLFDKSTSAAANDGDDYDDGEDMI